MNLDTNLITLVAVLVSIQIVWPLVTFIVIARTIKHNPGTKCALVNDVESRAAFMVLGSSLMTITPIVSAYATPEAHIEVVECTIIVVCCITSIMILCLGNNCSNTIMKINKGVPKKVISTYHLLNTALVLLVGAMLGAFIANIF